LNPLRKASMPPSTSDCRPDPGVLLDTRCRGAHADVIIGCNQVSVREQRRDWGPPKLVLIACRPLLRPTAAAQVREIRSLLIFIELDLSSLAVAQIDQETRAGLDKTPCEIGLYGENLESTLLPDKPSQRQFPEWYSRDHRDRKPDLIIGVGPAPIKFMVNSHGRFLADNPKLDSNFTDAWMMVEPANTLEATLKFKLGAKARGCSRWCNVAAMVRERLCKLERRSSGGRSRRRGRANSGGDTGRLLRPGLVRFGNRPRRAAGRRDARARVTAARSIRDRKRAWTRQTVRAVLPIPHEYAWSSADGKAVQQPKIAKEPARSKGRRAGSDG
jgi:hypothetical protein